MVKYSRDPSNPTSPPRSWVRTLGFTSRIPGRQLLH
ncbi:60S ribosomal protein L17 [Iris pallida]|uniref:60S ribosomal protein L17 n=1 Tax=Iris pallida TaxID=29817 RepID=A0AAX6EFB8_IRIPA|nr:60S ribosomal protein L17 [Iris pallida]